MAASFTVTVDVKPLQRLAELLPVELKAALEELGEEIVADAQERAPVKTGYLRDHITDAVDEALNLTITAEAEYSAYVELGTRRAAAQPFVTPAVDQGRQRLPELVAEAFERAAKAAAG